MSSMLNKEKLIVTGNPVGYEQDKSRKSNNEKEDRHAREVHWGGDSRAGRSSSPSHAPAGASTADRLFADEAAQLDNEQAGWGDADPDEGEEDYLEEH